MSATATQNTDELRDLYRQLILDHARSPRHFGKLDDATHTASGVNPLCGDKLALYLHCGKSGSIENASFEGSGCAISVASASLLTDTVIGLDISQALEYFSAVTNRLTLSEHEIETSKLLNLDNLRALDGVRDYPSRVKCATLAWHALSAAIHQQAKPASTE